MSVSWASKDPNEVRSYQHSWLGRLNGAEIASATLTVAEGTVTLSNVANTVDAISATISGGADCEDAVIVSTIVTNEAIPQTLEESFLLKIRPSYFLNAGPSTSKKRDIVSMAYEECSLAGYEFDVTPEELFSGLRKLDAMMADWRMSSRDLDYNFPETFGGGDLDDYSGIPDAAVAGAAISLGMRIAPGMGKTMSSETRRNLAESMTTIRAMCARTQSMGWGRGTPAGAGNRLWGYWSPFMPVGRR